jgi:DNA-binding beta-propeller fold protein YncE
MKMRTYPGREIAGHEMLVTSEGRIHKLTSWNTGYENWLGSYRLRTVNADGSIPADTGISGPQLLPDNVTSDTSQRQWIALSSDGKWVYLSSLRTRAKGGEHRNLHAVYRAPLDGSAAAELFLGSPDEAGSDEKHFDRPKGVAADGKGLLYVSDFGNNRICIFEEAEGSFVGSAPVEGPTTVQVHPGTGAIYVLAAMDKRLEVVKLSGRQDPREIARVPVGTYGDERYAVMVLDASAEPPVLWCGGSHYHIRKHLFRIEDKGGAFAEPREMASTAFSAGNCEDLMVDRARDELYFKPGTEKFARVQLATGEVTELPYPYIGGAAGTQLALSPDGELIYALSHLPGALRKFDRDFNPVAFESVGKNRLEIASPMSFSSRGLGVGPNGDIYLIPAGNTESTYCAVSEVQVYGPDGKRKGTAIWRCSQGATGPRFDRQGNLYLAECIKEPGKPFPDWFEGRLPPFSAETDRDRGAVSAPAGSAAWMYASIVKFPPTGGIIWYMPDIWRAPEYQSKGGWGEEIPPEMLSLPKLKVGSIGTNFDGFIDIDVQGAFWYYYGASPFADKCGNYDCNCQSARFDVDDYGRVFFPDAGRFRVGVLDTNGNYITAFGHYGNRDSAGPDSPIPEPEVAFAYPYAAAVSRTHVLVGDLLNNRIVKLRLAYQAEESCPVR